MKLVKWLKKADPPEQPKIDPEKCEHKEWSPRYDYTTYPGAVAFLESHCLACGMPERGSGQ